MSFQFKSDLTCTVAHCVTAAGCTDPLQSGQKLLFLRRNSITRKVEELQCSNIDQR
jgi:hypothetical protein